MSRPVLGVTGLLGLLGLSGGLLLACAPRQGGWSFPEAESWRRVGMRSGRFASAAADVPGSMAGSRTAPHADPVADSDADPVALGLFARNCATCHGTDGSGQGPSVLDRPARNFKDGGFSFGNTADAIFNTISYGIPGTPMPAFGEALGEGERRQLADFVRTLGPPVEDVDEADTIMTVTDTPLIVRGILPPIVEGAPMRPRGLLIGLPGGEGPGLTFEYRIDDVRLLGVRQGGFVARTDWNDRGGTPLKPLGGLIWTDAGGDPPATFRLDSGSLLHQRLASTQDRTLRWTLLTEGGMAVAEVDETIGAIVGITLNGFSRSLVVSSFSWNFPHELLRLHVPTPASAKLVESIEPESRASDDYSRRTTFWRVFRRDDGVYECTGLQLENRGGGPMPTLGKSGSQVEVVIRTPENSPGGSFWPSSVVTTITVFCTNWSAETRATLLDIVR